MDPDPARTPVLPRLRNRRALLLALAGLVLVVAGVRVVAAAQPGVYLVAPAPPVPAAGPPTTAAATPSRTPAPAGAGPTSAPKLSPKAKAPKSVPVPDTGPGTYVGSAVSAPAVTKRGTLKRYDVRVEKGLDLDPEQAARLIAGVLDDQRSWRGSGRWRFELVAAGQPADLHAYLVTPGTTNKLCAPLLTRGEVSCQNGNEVVLNAKRWVLGADAYGDDVDNYRRYLVNHEFGHALGHSHVPCPGAGRPAPVMMQQTKGLDGCRAKPWPRGD